MNKDGRVIGVTFAIVRGLAAQILACPFDLPRPLLSISGQTYGIIFSMVARNNFLTIRREVRLFRSVAVFLLWLRCSRALPSRARTPCSPTRRSLIRLGKTG